jgi:hypothetical protein
VSVAWPSRPWGIRPDACPLPLISFPILNNMLLNTANHPHGRALPPHDEMITLVQDCPEAHPGSESQGSSLGAIPYARRYK